MRINFSLFVLILLNMSCSYLLAQNKRYSDYYLIRRNYENFSENDSKAIPFINTYILKAKKEQNFKRLFQGYSDAVLYSPSPNDKLKYADSTIIAANLSRNDQLISEAFLEKGVVYYFQFKKYKLALDEYLKACKYINENTDEYHRNRLIYLIGVVKSYIGYYNEALTNFEQSRSFFEQESQKSMHPNIKYGFMRGYFNSIHQMIVCYRNLSNFKSADSLIAIGLRSSCQNNEYKQEYGYFLKEKGIVYFRQKQYEKAINLLLEALKSISSVNDFAWASVCYSYIGKSYLGLNQKEKARDYFQKVDSVFQKHGFVLPEVRSSYELLIKYYKQEKSSKQELYYTTELLNADSFISRDFAYLSSRIHKEFDTKRLREEKSRLERESLVRQWMSIVFGSLAIFFFIGFILWYRKGIKIKKQYETLTQKIIYEKIQPIISPAPHIKDIGKLGIDPKIIGEIVQKLNAFERKEGFLENGLTLGKLAKKLDTNTQYLSQVINELKGINFNKYIGELRIRYISNKLYSDKKYLNFKIETLAEECGIASRTNFSNLFQEINGMRPTDFIKQRLKEVHAQKEDLQLLNKTADEVNE